MVHTISNKIIKHRFWWNPDTIYLHILCYKSTNFQSILLFNPHIKSWRSVIQYWAYSLPYMVKSTIECIRYLISSIIDYWVYSLPYMVKSTIECIHYLIWYNWLLSVFSTLYGIITGSLSANVSCMLDIKKEIYWIITLRDWYNMKIKKRPPDEHF